jgi:hypothetical protein
MDDASASRIAYQSRAFNKVRSGRVPMKIIFSRKGFDTTFGGVPSPIIHGVPYSLPIPTGEYPSKISILATLYLR